MADYSWEIRYLIINLGITQELFRCLKKTLNEKQKEIYNEQVVIGMERIIDALKQFNLTDEELSKIKNSFKKI